MDGAVKGWNENFRERVWFEDLCIGIPLIHKLVIHEYTPLVADSVEKEKYWSVWYEMFKFGFWNECYEQD